MTRMHYDRLARLQNVCFENDADKMKQLALTNISNIDTVERIEQWSDKLPLETMLDICERVCFMD